MRAAPSIALLSVLLSYNWKNPKQRKKRQSNEHSLNQINPSNNPLDHIPRHDAYGSKADLRKRAREMWGPPLDPTGREKMPSARSTRSTTVDIRSATMIGRYGDDLRPVVSRPGRVALAMACQYKINNRIDLNYCFLCRSCEQWRGELGEEMRHWGLVSFGGRGRLAALGNWFVVSVLGDLSRVRFLGRLVRGWS